MKPDFDVVVVGAGFAGLYLIHKLRAMGWRVVAFEKGGGIGGTWYWNRYPGARCDVESLQYSYQFDEDLQQDWDWSEHYAPQPEILRYANHVADRFDLRRDVRLNTRVASAKWDDPTRSWQVGLDNGTDVTARFVIFATGCLSVPNVPKIDGLKEFEGRVYHTGNWPHEPVSFAGQRLGVIGTGSSGIQSIPELAKQAETLTVFQRTPNFAVPAHNRQADPARVAAVKADYAGMRARQRASLGNHDGVFNPTKTFDVSKEARQAEFEKRWDEGGLYFLGAFGDTMLDANANAESAEFVRGKIRAAVHDPVVAEQLCPEHVIGGKRLCVDSGYFETYNQPHVRLVDTKSNPLEQVTKTGIQTRDQHFDLDALVLATGFDAMTGALLAVDILGDKSVSLRDQWRDGPVSYLGLAMHGFPNLFTITGPGSPSVLTNMLPSIEQHVDWVCACLDYLGREDAPRIEAQDQAAQDWTNQVHKIADGFLRGGTASWYTGQNIAGKPVGFMPYMGGVPKYLAECERVVSAGYKGFAIT